MGVQTFRKKPVVIEAMRFEGGAANAIPIEDWVLANGGTASWSEAHDGWESEDGTQGYPAAPESISIDTPEGTQRAGVGDYVIRGGPSEFYPCTQATLEATYDRV